MFGILIAMFGRSYSYQCFFITFMQILFLTFYKLFDYLPIDILKRWLAKDFMTEQEEQDLEN